MACIDDAEPVALGIGQDDEVGVVRVPIPVDARHTKSDEPLDLGGLVGSIACVEIQMDSGGLLDGRLADIKRQMGTVA